MIGRIVSFVVALSAMAAASCVLVVSASFAFYALVRTYVGPSGAAAFVTLAAALVLAILALVMFGRAKKFVGKQEGEDGGIVGKLTGLLGDRPIVAAGAAVAAGLLAWRNPALVSTILRATASQPRAGKQR